MEPKKKHCRCESAVSSTGAEISAIVAEIRGVEPRLAVPPCFVEKNSKMSGKQ
jgi:hypothetical protein